MKIIALAVLVAFAGQDDALEGKKKRVAEVVRGLFAIEKKVEAEPKLRNDVNLGEERKKLVQELQGLLKEITGGDDRKKFEPVIKEAIHKYAPDLEPELQKQEIQANERSATSCLKMLGTAEADFRANDRDGNLINDFWTGDVASFCYLAPLTPDCKVPAEKDRVAMRLIEESLADADVAPQKLESSTKKPAEKPTPKYGYLFAALVNEASEKGPIAYRVDTDPSPAFGAVHNLDRFGFAAYPAEYGKTGKMTFIINEANRIWKKDLGGKTIVDFPADPAKDGWSKLD